MGFKKIGAIWNPKPGKKAMTGQVEVNGIKQRFMIFENTRKNSDKQPDYEMMVSDDQPSQGRPESRGPGAFTEDDIAF